MIKTSIFIVSLLSATQAFATCGQRDAFGWWHVMNQDANTVLYCEVYIRAGGALSNSSSCTLIDPQGQVIPVGLTGGRLTVKENCRVEGSFVNALGQTATIIDGQMSRDGQLVISIGTQEGVPFTSTAMKFK